jgi:hypothetical protein
MKRNKGQPLQELLKEFILLVLILLHLKSS